MTDKIVILVTAGSLREARKIARSLLEQKLAACVNISPPVQSVYRWQGRVEAAKEFLLIIKSTRELFDPIKAEVLKLHSYTTPEIICLPIIDGSAEYLRWLEELVRK